MLTISKILEKRVRLEKALRTHGVLGTIKAAIDVLVPPKAATLPICRNLVLGRNGLEIGGPTPGFKANGFLPLYPAIGKLDNCNFSFKTVWEGSVTGGQNFEFELNKPKGQQYVAEATDLKMIPDKTYDFIISCHTLEHTANPIRALTEWVRVLKENGGIVLVVPHKAQTFDHRRPVTTLEHLVEDLNKDTKENDLTHLREVLEFTDLDRDAAISHFSEFKQRCEQNFQLRCIHHHVFKTSLLVQIMDYIGLQILSAESIRPFHSIVSARKMTHGEIPRNQIFLASNAVWRRKSPFKMDRELI